MPPREETLQNIVHSKESLPCYETYHGQTSILELVQLQLLQSLLVFGKAQGIELEVTGLFIQKKRCQKYKKGYEWV